MELVPRRFARFALLCLLAAAPLAARPSFVLLMADDQGWGDVGYNGHPRLRTPHLDAMARAGVRLDRFYAAAPVCSPTRGSVLTGRHPSRYGIDWAFDGQLPAAEVTLAEALRAAGFATASIGKWHLGGKGSLAEDHGFEVNYYGNNLGSPKTMFGPDHGLGLAPTPPGNTSPTGSRTRRSAGSPRRGSARSSFSWAILPCTARSGRRRRRSAASRRADPRRGACSRSTPR